VNIKVDPGCSKRRSSGARWIARWHRRPDQGTIIGRQGAGYLAALEDQSVLARLPDDQITTKAPEGRA